MPQCFLFATFSFQKEKVALKKFKIKNKNIQHDLAKLNIFTKIVKIQNFTLKLWTFS